MGCCATAPFLVFECGGVGEGAGGEDVGVQEVEDAGVDGVEGGGGGLLLRSSRGLRGKEGVSPERSRGGLGEKGEILVRVHCCCWCCDGFNGVDGFVMFFVLKYGENTSLIVDVR